MARFDFWTHGVAAILQPTAGSAGTQNASHRTDLGTVVENGVGKENWLHLPIATPTIIEGNEASLRNIRVALTLNDNARLARIHVRSGRPWCSTKAFRLSAKLCTRPLTWSTWRRPGSGAEWRSASS